MGAQKPSIAVAARALSVVISYSQTAFDLSWMQRPTARMCLTARILRTAPRGSIVHPKALPAGGCGAFGLGRGAHASLWHLIPEVADRRAGPRGAADIRPNALGISRGALSTSGGRSACQPTRLLILSISRLWLRKYRPIRSKKSAAWRTSSISHHQ